MVFVWNSCPPQCTITYGSDTPKPKLSNGPSVLRRSFACMTVTQTEAMVRSHSKSRAAPGNLRQNFTSHAQKALISRSMARKGVRKGPRLMVAHMDQVGELIWEMVMLTSMEPWRESGRS
jgi:hypothetical protein